MAKNRRRGLEPFSLFSEGRSTAKYCPGSNTRKEESFLDFQLWKKVLEARVFGRFSHHLSLIQNFIIVTKNYCNQARFYICALRPCGTSRHVDFQTKMKQVTIARDGKFFDLGSYKPEVCQIAEDLGNILVDKFWTPEGTSSVISDSDLAQHPDVQELLNKPDLESALKWLRDTELPMQLFLEMGGEAEASYASEMEDPEETMEETTPAPTPTAGAPPAAVPAEHATPEVINLVDDSSDEDDAAASALKALAAGAAPAQEVRQPAAASQQGQQRLPRHWAEWPEGSGSFAVVITRQNFPARIALQNTSGE